MIYHKKHSPKGLSVDQNFTRALRNQYVLLIATLTFFTYQFLFLYIEKYFYFVQKHDNRVAEYIAFTAILTFLISYWKK